MLHSPGLPLSSVAVPLVSILSRRPVEPEYLAAGWFILKFRPAAAAAAPVPVWLLCRTLPKCCCCVYIAATSLKQQSQHSACCCPL